MWFVANSCSDLADAHDAAKTAVSGCSPSGVLNDRAELIGLGTAVAEAWTAARDELVIAISQNARSCDDTAAALKLCIEHFTSTDVNVKNELDDKKEEIPYE